MLEIGTLNQELSFTLQNLDFEGGGRKGHYESQIQIIDYLCGGLGSQQISDSELKLICLRVPLCHHLTHRQDVFPIRTFLVYIKSDF